MAFSNSKPIFRLLDSFEPNLVPVWVDGPRAKQTIATEVSTAGYPVENKAGAWHSDHLPGFLVDYFLNPTEHTIGLIAVRQHLDIVKETTIPVFPIDGARDLIL